MAEYILLSIFIVFIILFVIYSRTKKLRNNFRHNMDEEEVAIEPREPKPRRSLEDTLKALTQRHELPKIEEEVNPAENLLQEVRERRARELMERNKSLKDIPEKKPIIPKLGNPIVESPETRRLKQQLNRGRKSSRDVDDTMNRGSRPKNYYMDSDNKQNEGNNFASMMRNPDSAKNAFIASEIFKTKF
ncbi:hypothetical protein Fleli_1052 [Bernardetia litoralis DSM 6794]|uniref:Uncharacterized protein n=1 Tax=Bernardetia litoralis (strain ATCC 23117 / DSM 6794 / NBRC 15988 / NCIMB 1366 / Fx l1 / Sio-4) TaxID=880071 RepID=I4AHR2_BERLS|nr:hypothetical protein [Bernardetia litoralis]AFM03497.1 hypothetical protein Fleli_1052 [Bernardetia litoralis DSM 6794]